MPKGSRPNLRENNILSKAIKKSGNKTGKKSQNSGATWADVGINNRKWQPSDRKSGNTYKAKPGAK